MRVKLFLTLEPLAELVHVVLLAVVVITHPFVMPVPGPDPYHPFAPISLAGFRAKSGAWGIHVSFLTTRS